MCDPAAYAVLGLLPSAEQEVVDAAIRVLFLKYHPDKVGARGQEAFQKIWEAASCVRSGKRLPRPTVSTEGLRDKLRAIWGPLRS